LQLRNYSTQHLFFSNFHLIVISNCFLYLKKLILYKCDSIIDVGLLPILNRCSKIEYLDICYCYKITDISLIAISRNLLCLTYLNLNGCYKITDKGLMEVAKSCLKLKSLYIYCCFEISDASLVVISKYLNLDFLCLEGCNNIKNKKKFALENKIKLIYYEF
jgi:hypothetical protein